jgi:tetratricopeptide (TPR) repeat protein
MNQNLVKARLLYDGGYYEQSLTKLKQIEFNNLPSAYQKTEYYYRFARVYHDLGDFSHAIKMYQECLTLGSNMNTYFTPNTCLQLGLIYSKLGYPDLAKKYFIQVSNYSGYDYEDSIKQKAKAGLNQIR